MWIFLHCFVCNAVKHTCTQFSRLHFVHSDECFKNRFCGKCTPKLTLWSRATQARGGKHLSEDGSFRITPAGLLSEEWGCQILGSVSSAWLELVMLEAVLLTYLLENQVLFHCTPLWNGMICWLSGQISEVLSSWPTTVITFDNVGKVDSSHDTGSSHKLFCIDWDEVESGRWWNDITWEILLKQISMTYLGI